MPKYFRDLKKNVGGGGRVKIVNFGVVLLSWVLFDCVIWIPEDFYHQNQLISQSYQQCEENKVMESTLLIKFCRIYSYMY